MDSKDGKGRRGGTLKSQGDWSMGDKHKSRKVTDGTHNKPGASSSGRPAENSSRSRDKQANGASNNSGAANSSAAGKTVAADAKTLAGSKQSADSGQALIPGWERMWSRTKKRTYYLNKGLGVSQWTLPTIDDEIIILKNQEEQRQAQEKQIKRERTILIAKRRICEHEKLTKEKKPTSDEDSSPEKKNKLSNKRTRSCPSETQPKRRRPSDPSTEDRNISPSKKTKSEDPKAQSTKWEHTRSQSSKKTEDTRFRQSGKTKDVHNSKDIGCMNKEDAKHHHRLKSEDRKSTQTMIGKDTRRKISENLKTSQNMTQSDCQKRDSIHLQKMTEVAKTRTNIDAKDSPADQQRSDVMHPLDVIKKIGLPTLYHVAKSSSEYARTVASEEATVDQEESMEAETYPEDYLRLLTDIEEIRQDEQTDLVSGPLRERFLSTDNTESPVSTGAASKAKQMLFLIIDTNVYLNSLPFVKMLTSKVHRDFHPGVIVVPWVVMGEIDTIKDNKQWRVSDSTSSKARQAVHYLNQRLEARCPQLIGQTPAEAQKVYPELGQVTKNDDKILQCCVQWKDKYPDSSVFLLTGDVHLRSRAMITGVSAYSEKSLATWFNGNENVVRVHRTLPKGYPVSVRSIPKTHPLSVISTGATILPPKNSSPMQTTAETKIEKFSFTKPASRSSNSPTDNYGCLSMRQGEPKPLGVPMADQLDQSTSCEQALSVIQKQANTVSPTNNFSFAKTLRDLNASNTNRRTSETPKKNSFAAAMAEMHDLSSSVSSSSYQTSLKPSAGAPRPFSDPVQPQDLPTPPVHWLAPSPPPAREQEPSTTTPDLTPETNNTQRKTEMRAQFLTRLEALLVTSLGRVLETEMVTVYQDMWRAVIYRNPPWSLTDILECLRKHWISVFGDLFGRQNKYIVDDLLTLIKDSGESRSWSFTVSLVTKTLIMCKEFYTHKRCPVLARLRSYLQSILDTVAMVTDPSSSSSQCEERLLAAVGDAKQVETDADAITTATTDPGSHVSTVTSPVDAAVSGIQDAFQHVWQLILDKTTQLKTILSPVGTAPNNTSSAPQREDVVRELAEFCTLISAIHTQYKDVLNTPLSDPNTPSPSHARLTTALTAIARHYGIAGWKDIDHLEMRIYDDESRRPVLQNGFAQLENLMGALSECQGALTPQEVGYVQQFINNTTGVT